MCRPRTSTSSTWSSCARWGPRVVACDRFCLRLSSMCLFVIVEQGPITSSASHVSREWLCEPRARDLKLTSDPCAGPLSPCFEDDTEKAVAHRCLGAHVGSALQYNSLEEAMFVRRARSRDSDLQRGRLCLLTIPTLSNFGSSHFGSCQFGSGSGWVIAAVGS